MLSSNIFDDLILMDGIRSKICKSVKKGRIVLISGPSCSGKTTILNIIKQKYTDKCSYFDFNANAHKDFLLEKELYHIADIAIQGNISFVLFDNIESRINKSPINSSIVSAFVHVLDTILQFSAIILTCTYYSQLHDTVNVAYRLSSHIQLSYPFIAHRSEYLYKFLSHFKLIEGKDRTLVPIARVAEFASDLAARTQGYSLVMLQKVISDAAMQSQLKFHCESDTIITDMLLSNLSLISLPLVENSFVSSLILNITLKPHLIGYDDTITQLLHEIRSSRISGLIIHGSSGVGKSTFASRIAYECHKTHTVLQVSCAELVHRVVGESEKKLVEIFHAARLVSPSIVILDNLDTIIGVKRDPKEFTPEYHSRRTAHKAIDRLLSCLLVEIDGISKGAMEPVLVIATATNLSEIDRSLLRPGRLEEHIQLTLPSQYERRELFQYYLSRIPLSVQNETAFIEELVLCTEGFSPAEIQQIVTEASMTAARMHLLLCKDLHEDNTKQQLSRCQVHRDCFAILKN